MEEHAIAILRSFYYVNSPRVGAENAGGFGDYSAHGPERRTGHSNGISGDTIWKPTGHQPIYPPNEWSLDLLPQM